MVDTKVSALPAVTTPDGTDEFLVNQAGTSKKVTLAQINAYTDPLRSASTAAQAMAVADTYITSSRIVLPQAKMQAGVFYRCVLTFTKTAGTAASTVTVRTGTAGTTADTSRATLATAGTHTSVADVLTVEVEATFRAVGAAAVINTTIRSFKNAATNVGFGTQQPFITNTTSATFDSSSSSMGIGVSFTGGTAFAGSAQQVIPELKNMAD